VRTNREYAVFAAIVDEARIDYSIPLGAVEEWARNNKSDVPHPFYIHTNPFELIQINGQNLAQKIWMHVVNVPANSSIKFRTRFEEVFEKFVLHYHIFWSRGPGNDEEDNGLRSCLACPDFRITD